jgi:hypothetical protein
MGVKQFNKTFVSRNIPASLDAMRDTCAAVAIDTNQFIHQALGKFIEQACMAKDIEDKSETYTLKQNLWNETTEGLHSMFMTKCKTVLSSVIDELCAIKNLREVFVTMDGTPCYGKIQNQIVRRRNPKRVEKVVIDSHGKERRKLVLSSAHIIPGTPLMEAFTTALREKIDEFSTKRRDVSITLSLADIPGEGEHKALDYLNASPYTSFNRVEDVEGDRGKRVVVRSFLIWSNDSDVIISLLHRAVVNVYVMTDVNVLGGTALKCISLSAVRENICQERHDVLNSPLLLAFAGNDYLPEMLDTLNLQIAYSRMQKLCNSVELSEPLCLTKEVRSSDTPVLSLKVRESDEVMPGNVFSSEERVQPKTTTRMVARTEYGSNRVIDTEALCKFFRMMAEVEISNYYAGVESTHRSLTRTILLRYDEDYARDPVQFKRKYYKTVLKELLKIGASPVEPCVPKEPTDSELYDLEMEIATSYLRTYYWYYYYQSGMTTGHEMDNTYYPYSFPPLYSSLFIVLDRAKREHMIRFDFTYNPILEPRPRGLGYFNSLPDFTKLHQYIVLQPDDYRLLLEQKNEQNSVFNGLEPLSPEVPRSQFVVSRNGEMLELNKPAKIHALLERFHQFIRKAASDTVRLGPVNPAQSMPMTFVSDRFKVKEVVSM